MKFQAIRDNIGRFPVGLMCSALQVSTSGYYAWRDRRPSPRAQANEQLLSQIREAHQRSCSAGMELESLSRSNRDRTGIFLDLIHGEVGDEEIQKALRA